MSIGRLKKRELGMKIKVLNIAQPNAHYVFYNGKNVENRSMQTKRRGLIAIYGSKTVQKDRFEYSIANIEDCSFGYIVGFVELVDCITKKEVTSKTKEWFSGEYGWVLKNPIALKTPIKVSPPKGAIIWWELKGSKAKKCLDQLPKNLLSRLCTE